MSPQGLATKRKMRNKGRRKKASPATSALSFSESEVPNWSELCGCLSFPQSSTPHDPMGPHQAPRHIGCRGEAGASERALFLQRRDRKR